jgi:hypothetical protein
MRVGHDRSCSLQVYTPNIGVVASLTTVIHTAAGIRRWACCGYRELVEDLLALRPGQSGLECHAHYGEHETLWLTEWGADGRSTFRMRRASANDCLNTAIATGGLLQFVIAEDDGATGEIIVQSTRAARKMPTNVGAQCKGTEVCRNG